MTELVHQPNQTMHPLHLVYCLVYFFSFVCSFLSLFFSGVVCSSVRVFVCDPKGNWAKEERRKSRKETKRNHQRERSSQVDRRGWKRTTYAVWGDETLIIRVNGSEVESSGALRVTGTDRSIRCGNLLGIQSISDSLDSTPPCSLC